VGRGPPQEIGAALVSALVGSRAAVLGLTRSIEKRDDDEPDPDVDDGVIS
jgi:hypothetical protein